ncbi:zonular occludens toxin domain-containing protein [Nitrosomonas sp.]|uniref:zonular occludens toxin domain-containing protein n=1 Tax=Nitrosomonas sp. TaxID=42353 RepID=UPI00262A2CB0|nr:zonular occludens toxin domain-containing protein [Nitrosomonas sp.]MCW5600234.1 zonular occludens toxin [Nitrosomonas sp.]
MSLTLITAAPGAGKTIHAVYNIIRPALETGRVVYTVGIPELKLPTIRLSYAAMKQWYEREKIETPSQYQEDLIEDEIPTRLLNITEGAIIVIDEAQCLWPSVGARDVTEDISYLSKHRHHGLEIILITQSPQLIHNKVLAIVDKHIHMMNDWTGRKMYEWPEYCGTVRAAASKLRAVSKRYEIPKQAFGLYRSASIHVKQNRNKPKMFYMLPIVLLAIPTIAYMFYQQVVTPRLADAPVLTELEQINDETITTIPNTDKPATIQYGQNATINDKPILPVTHAVVSNTIDWEKVSACLSTKDKCICYGHNAERLVIPPETCRIAAQHGWPGKNVVITATNL